VAWKYIREELWDRDLLDEEEFEKTNRLITWHDTSKVSKEEWGAYSERLYGDNKSNPNIKANFKEAVKKHKERNLHHYESLRDYKGNDWKCYVVELVCDYIAMGWELDNYILEYYDKVKDEINLPPEYKSYLETILSMLREDSLSAVEKPITNEFVSEMLYKDTILTEKKYTFHSNQGQE
jgi:hypothetical protein